MTQISSLLYTPAPLHNSFSPSSWPIFLLLLYLLLILLLLLLYHLYHLYHLNHLNHSTTLPLFLDNANGEREDVERYLRHVCPAFESASRNN